MLLSQARVALDTLADRVFRQGAIHIDRVSALVDQLRDEVRAVELPDAKTASGQLWLENQRELRDLVLSRDPYEFLTWNVILRTMFVGNNPYVARELAYLHRDSAWSTWRSVIDESPVGRPPPFFLRPSASGARIHAAYHVARYLERGGVSIPSLETIVEFGGGYGCLASVFQALGFRGRYVIFDLPLFSALQRFYLRARNFGVAAHGAPAAGDANMIHCVSDASTLASLVAGRAPGKALFAATWSLSESPMGVREPVVSTVASFEHFLMAYQDAFLEVDNLAYFDSWAPRSNPRVTWTTAPTIHRRGHTYAFGYPK